MPTSPVIVEMFQSGSKWPGQPLSLPSPKAITLALVFIGKLQKRREQEGTKRSLDMHDGVGVNMFFVVALRYFTSPFCVVSM